jgi:hypothetical protein
MYNVQEGKVAIGLSLHGEMDVRMYIVHKAKSRLCRYCNGASTWACRLPC